MHGLGNDFVVLDNVRQELPPSFTRADSIRRLSCRKRGVGFDQMLLVGKTTTTAADFNYRIFNADGGEIGQCGNGVRCVHAFARRVGLSDKDELVWVTTTAQIRTVWQKSNAEIRADMPTPQFQPSIKFNGYTFHLLDIGNPHAVCFSGDDVGDAALKKMGREFNEDTLHGINVGFATVAADGIHLRVYERGVGVTDACGSGALAAAIAAIQNEGSRNPTTVFMAGGALRCGMNDDGTTWQQGGVAHVYDGVLNWESA